MQHNNNKNDAIAKELNDVIKNIAEIKTDSISESLEVVENNISHLDQLSQDMDLPELRALTHWMMLNIELDDDNKEQLTILLEDGSYHNWMNVLSMLLQEYDQSLLPVIYKALTEPNWVVKPSAPLLRNLASWIESSKSIQSSETSIIDVELPESDEHINQDKTDSSKETASKEQENSSALDLDVDITNKHIFEDVELEILDKNYQTPVVMKDFSESSDELSELQSEKSLNYYDEIEADKETDPTELVFSANSDEVDVTETNEVDRDTKLDESPIHINELNVEETINNSILDSSTEDFSAEVDDIVMSLASLNAESRDIFENIPTYEAELQRFDMLADISGYETLLPISGWCLRNLKKFDNDQSESAREFIASGECWTWMELIKIAIEHPEEISTISELNVELSRNEWLEPLSTEDLQSLLLFLHNPQKESKKDENIVKDESLNATDKSIEVESTEPVPVPETIQFESDSNVAEQEATNETLDTEKDTNQDTEQDIIEEISEYSFSWDEDTHPELLEVYLDETDENIANLSSYLKVISTAETTKEQRQDSRRTAHTIKGGSAVVGITALSTYAYQLEKILDYAIDHELPAETNDLLQKSSSCLKDTFKSIKDKSETPEEFSKILSSLITCAEAIEELDDEPLELSTPILPDFITQQNVTNDLDAEAEKLDIDTIEVTEPEKTILDVIETEVNSNESTASDELETANEKDEIKIDLEEYDTAPISESEEAQTIVETEINEAEEFEKTEETSLPTLDQTDEIDDFTAELDDIVMTLVTTDVQAEKKPFNLDPYIEELHRLTMLAEISGYPEISVVNNWYQENLKLIAKKGTKKLGKFISSGQSWAWIELVSATLADPDEISGLSEISTELTRAEWVKELDVEALQSLLLTLRNPEFYNEGKSNEENGSEENNESIRDIETKIEETNIDSTLDDTDVNQNIITWDDDVHPELLSVYLQETAEQVTKIAELLQLIAKGNADKDQQEQAARIAHTIKGASGVVGITEIVDLTHKLEDILDYTVNNEIPEETSDLLAESSDCLESLFEAVQEKTEAPEEFESVLTKLTAYTEVIASDIEAIDGSASDLEMPELPESINQEESSSGISDTKETLETNDNETEFDSIVSDNKDETSAEDVTENVSEKKGKNETENIESDAPVLEEQNIQDVVQELSTLTNEITDNETTESKNTILQTPISKPTTAAVSESHIRVPTSLINKLLNLAGELVTTSSQVSDKVEKTIVTSGQIKAQDARVHEMLNELSTTIYKQEKDQITMLSSMQNKNFDELEMDTYNELHSVAGLLTESILDSEDIENTLKTQLNEIHDDLRLLDNLNKELSETILNSRMESLNTLIPRLERIVRQTCRKTNKQAELIVTGNDINIDTEILTGLVDPLLHLLRNAIDHGIENAEDRISNKKDPVGQIQLDFSRQGNFIHMQLKDDGAGINSEKIYQHAINRGLITPDQEYSKSEVLKLILEPGFSTQTDVTDISGRGVGMDVVNKAIEALKGSLAINTDLGLGSTFNVKIPLTLVTSSTLLVESAGNKVAIPTDSIEQLFYLSPEDVLNRKDNKYIRHEGKELVIESLAGILGWDASNVDFTKAQTLLLVKGSQQLHAIYIDQIIHSREVVIKSLAHFIDGSKGLIGACHLSDGEVAPVMNLPQLLRQNEQTSYIVKQLEQSDAQVSIMNHTPQILVVDDSLSNRKALSLIIEKTNYDVITAVDGLDALNVMNEQHIDLVFTDLEMPRMTGLELTQAIRAWEEKKEVPIVMVTSRSTNKHRELAKKAGVDDYLTKPVGTETLLDSIETWLKQTVEA